ncbi:MAG: hypothetical protein EOO61_17160 [Hymenobacter sp.]|nr:MAG: hypothetical protein EOO61_17160 [Hymenobacter sp.]
MLDVFIAKHHQATIVRTQTTYMDVAVASGTVRLHYRDKREFSLKTGVRGVLSQALEHPLLWDYNGPCTTVYLSGPAPDPPALLKALQEVVASVSQHWRTLDHYLHLTQLELNHCIMD